MQMTNESDRFRLAARLIATLVALGVAAAGWFLDEPWFYICSVVFSLAALAWLGPFKR